MITKFTPHTICVAHIDNDVIMLPQTSEGVLFFLKLHIGESSYHDMSLPLKKMLVEFDYSIAVMVCVCVCVCV